MTDSSPALTRFVALIAMTAVFAGLWANDGPSRPAVRAAHASRTVLAAVSPAEVTEFRLTAPISTTNSAVQIGRTVKTIAIESAHLNLSERELADHVGQLPMGIPAGDYRIVDSQGGVGWLRVRFSEPADGVSGIAAASTLMTTCVGDDEVRFIRVRGTQTAAIEASITR